jgi:CubicO group peptidase (beta-lactamase class C family)
LWQTQKRFLLVTVLDMTLISRKKIVYILAFAGGLLLLQAMYYTWQVIAIGAAYKTKVLCSGMFVSHRSPHDILYEDLESILSMMDTKIDFEKKSVTTYFPGVPAQRAIFREGLGCTLLAGASEAEVLRDGDTAGMNILLPAAKQKTFVGLRSPGKNFPPEVSRDKLAGALDKAFSEKDMHNPANTKAVVVVYDGRMIAEHYAPGISADTALSGWSLAKSVTNALVGILVLQGKLSIDQPAPIAEWSGPNDPRKAITLDNLLRMSSGLKFSELPGPFVSDVNLMLLRSRDAAAYAIDKSLQYEPGTYWHYSSGTANIISRIIRNCFGDDSEAYYDFPRKALFNRIGMTSTILEVDASGTFVGSSFIYATARDWARFGLLYLQDGVWEGTRILPPGWVTYTTRPTLASQSRPYGALFWLNRGDMTSNKPKPFEKLPLDTFYASGYEGQNLVMIPSRKLVIVRLGMTKNGKAWEMESFVSDVLAAISANK